MRTVPHGGKRRQRSLPGHREALLQSEQHRHLAGAEYWPGPVDFKTSRGFALHALLEVKLAKNSRFWNGLKNQLSKYLEAEEVRFGQFILIAYTDRDVERLKDIREQAVNAETRRTIDVVVVDARQNPTSASKL